MLELCGRSHSLYDVYRAIEDVHSAGPASWSLDLISGLPHLIEEKWRDSLSRAIDAEPPHISVYDLQASWLIGSPVSSLPLVWLLMFPPLH